MITLTPLIPHCTGSSSKSNKEIKRNGITFGKEEISVLKLREYLVKNPKISTQNLLELISGFRMISGTMKLNLRFNEILLYLHMLTTNN